MRALLLMLVLLNAAYFAWSYYSSGLASAESHLVNQQIKPEAVRLLTPAQVAVARSESSKTVACMEWGGFNAADAAKVDEALAPLALGGRLSQRRAEETASWWVYMPPQANRPAAVLKAAELKRLGVDDYFIVQDDAKSQFTLSLGVFRTEEAARKRLEQLRTRNVRTAQVGQRATAIQRVYYEVRAVDEATSAKLTALSQGFPGTELKECGKAATTAAQ
jgi:hypothetical protein